VLACFREKTSKIITKHEIREKNSLSDKSTAFFKKLAKGSFLSKLIVTFALGFL
jgi:hypothetical protein